MNMIYNADDISKLTLDEIAGTITPEDKERLYSAIAGNQAALEVWQEVHNRFAAPGVLHAMETLPERLTAEQVMEMTDKRSRKIFYIKAAASVAASVIVVLGIYMLSRPATRQADTMAIAKKHIELQLAGGKNIDLSSEQGQLQVAGVSLNNSNKTLTYSSNSNTVQEWASLNVPDGKDYKIQLSDGTEIWLNAATSLQFPLAFTGSTREVSINGEAYLKVAKNAKKPFIVRLPNSTVQVLGTAFNVNTYDSGLVKVALVEGSVKMKAGKDSALLKPGYEIAYTMQKGMETALFDANDVLAWQRGIYLLNAASVQEVSRIINRHYGVEVILDDKMASQRTFTGSMDRNKPIQSFLEVLKFAKYIDDYYYSADSVLHIR